MNIAVIFRPGGRRYVYSASGVTVGDKVMVPTEGTSPGPALATVVAVHVPDIEGTEVKEILYKVRPGQHVEHPNS